MKKNIKYLLKRWIPILIFGLLLIAIIIRNSFKDPSYLLIPIVVIIVLVVIIFRSKAGVKKALLYNSPNKLIDTIVTPLKRTPQKILKEVYTVYNTSLSLVFYGEYDKALETMNSINWETKEPLFQALNLNIKSLISYFTHDFQQGLSYARRAKAIASTTDAFPGAKASSLAYEAYVEVGEVLNRLSNDHTIHSLELKFRKLPLLPKLIIAWGLMNGYKQNNSMSKYNDMKEFCNTTAPHCNSINSVVDDSG